MVSKTIIIVSVVLIGFICVQAAEETPEDKQRQRQAAIRQALLNIAKAEDTETLAAKLMGAKHRKKNRRHRHSSSSESHSSHSSHSSSSSEEHRHRRKHKKRTTTTTTTKPTTTTTTTTTYRPPYQMYGAGYNAYPTSYGAGAYDNNRYGTSGGYGANYGHAAGAAYNTHNSYNNRQQYGYSNQYKK